MSLKIIYCIAIIAGLFFLEDAQAQAPGNLKFKPKLDSTFLLPNRAFLPAKLVARNEKFDVYKLPIDNMPCLVPNKSFQSNMNTMKDRYKGSEYNMPNKFPKQEIIPQNNTADR